METILKIWPYVRIALEIIFFISTFLLVFLLIPLALSKKKLSIYIDQIKKQGSITPVSSFTLMYDLFLVAYIFATYPEIKNNAKFNQYKVIIELEKKISILTKIIKPVAIVYAPTVILLLVLLNCLGG